MSNSMTATAVKKTHSVKNTLLSLPDRRIMFLSNTFNGSVHDKRICDEQPLNLPKGINLWQDTGFKGHSPNGTKIWMPQKKPKGKELTQEQKQQNQNISRFRVLVEHAICGAKRCRIVKDRLRCHKLGFDDLIMELACGLHNFRLAMKNNAL
jgi:hypothetical protein